MPYLTDTRLLVPPLVVSAGVMMDSFIRTSMSRASVGERAQHRRASVVILPDGTPPGPVPPPARAGSTAARLLTHRSRSALSQWAAGVLSSTPPRSFEMVNAGIWINGTGEIRRAASLRTRWQCSAPRSHRSDKRARTRCIYGDPRRAWFLPGHKTRTRCITCPLERACEGSPRFLETPEKPIPKLGPRTVESPYVVRHHLRPAWRCSWLP